MGEDKILVFNKTFSYSGLLSVAGFYRKARTLLEDQDYGPYEVRHEEQVFPDGKEIFVELNGERKLSDYAQVRAISKLQFLNITDERVEIDDVKVSMNKGTVKVTTMIILTTDWDKSFEQNAFQYFLRVVMDKFVVKNYIYRAEKRAKKDYDTYESSLKNYLNMKEFR